MSSTKQILFAGFGGQGVLFAGKFLAYDGLIEEREVSWLPSYGPEMRGGTANCSVILSDTPIGSPIVTKPDVLVALNLPSLDKYEDDTVPGGEIFVNSSLITRKVKRTDVKAFYIPATQLASDNNMNLANMIMVGYMLKHDSEIMPYENVRKALEKVTSAKHPDMLEVNMRAIDIGYNYAG